MDKIKVNQLVELVEEFGKEMTIGQILEETGKHYRCPVCAGQGNLGYKHRDKKEPLSVINGYNSHVLTHLLSTHTGVNGDCTLCEGDGFLEDDLIPVETNIITGYMQRPME